MTKRVTLTQRWCKWAEGCEGHKAEPLWAYLALGTMMASFLSLGVHLCFFLDGMWTGGALISMCVFAGITEALFLFRKQYWWSWYWGLCVILGVLVFEGISYYFGGKL